MTRRYAEDTKVSASRSQDELRTLLRKSGAGAIGTMLLEDKAAVAFRLAERNILIRIAIPQPTDARKAAQEERRVWRALVLTVKAKLEAVHSGIETVEEAFLPHIRLASGETVYEQVRANLALSYDGTHNVPLLPAPGER